MGRVARINVLVQTSFTGRTLLPWTVATQPTLSLWPSVQHLREPDDNQSPPRLNAQLVVCRSCTLLQAQPTRSSLFPSRTHLQRWSGGRGGVSLNAAACIGLLFLLGWQKYIV